MKQVPDFARCDAFWDRKEVDRPLLSCWVGTFAVVEHYVRGMASLPNDELNPRDLDFEKFMPDYERLFAIHQATGVDVPWAAFPLMTLPWLEAIIGCPIHHRNGNVWADHWLDTYARLEEIELKPDNPWLERLLAFTDWLVELSDGRFPVALSLMRGPLDLLSAVRGPERMCLDLFDYPEQLHSALDRLTSIWIQVAHAQLAHTPAFEGGYSFSVINLWGKKSGGWFQDDAVALWSPKYYRRYLRACEERLSSCMGTTGIHLHPASLFVIEDLIAMPDLDVIEVNLEEMGPTLEEMIPTLNQALKVKNLVIWGDFTAGDLLLMKEHLPTRGLALQLMAPRPEGVRAKVEEVMEVWRD